MEEITNHVDQAQARMVKQFKDKTNIDKIIKIRASRLQQLETILIQLLNERGISTADGVQLDGIGEHYGSQGDRANRTDEEYRAFLQILPAKLRQAGQHEILIQAYSNLTGSAIETQYYYPRAMALIASVDDVDGFTNEDDINDQMQSIHAEGVRLDLGFKTTGQTFLFSNSIDGGVPANSGFSSLTDGSDGGHFMKLIG